MSLLVLEIFGFLLYTGILVYTWQRLSNSKPLGSSLSSVLLASIFIHGYIVYLNIDGGEGHNLGLFNIFAMTTWISMLIVYWNLLKHQAHALLLISLPIAAVSLLEIAIFDSTPAKELNQSGNDLWHILLGVSAMSLLILAAMQALLVLYIDNGLRNHPAQIHSWLGPLQSMERYLIQLLSAGFVLMSLALGLALLFPSGAETNQSLHKMILTILSWLVLATLLLGHYKKGWRGVFAAKWTLVGVFLLLLGYFGSKLVLEFLLQP